MKKQPIEFTFLEKDLEMKNIMEKHLLEEVYTHGNMNFETRELITLAVLTVNRANNMIKDHIKALLALNTAPEVIKEAIYHAIPYAGLISVNEVLPYVNEAMEESGVKLPLMDTSTVDEATRFQAGLKLQCAIFSREHIQMGHDNALAELKHIQNFLSAHCFGDFYTRKGLDMKQRELLTFCIIASIGGCENQLRAHTIGNLNVGNTREDLIEAMTQCQAYIGFPRTLNAIAIINEVTQSK